MHDVDVKLVTDGESCAAVFYKGDFDLCILDVMMPKKDGFSLARDIRAHDKDIPVIFLTARSMKEDILAGFNTGADDYITKPFNQNELELRVVNLLHLQQKNREYLQAKVISTEPKKKEDVITDQFLIKLYKEINAKYDNAKLGVIDLVRI